MGCQHRVLSCSKSAQNTLPNTRTHPIGPMSKRSWPQVRSVVCGLQEAFRGTRNSIRTRLPSGRCRYRLEYENQRAGTYGAISGAQLTMHVDELNMGSRAGSWPEVNYLVDRSAWTRARRVFGAALSVNSASDYERGDYNVGKAFKLFGVWQPVFFHARAGGKNH